jgi:hypothetical protein
LVNIQDFIDSFAKKRDALKIPKGVFKSSISTNLGTGLSKPLGSGVTFPQQSIGSLEEK